jgi:uncharacterized membrane protein required for colicin V production
MENMTPFDVVAFLLLMGMFILGYVQGLVRRAFGIIALLFSLIVAAQLREPLGTYLAHEWTTAPPEYSYMIAFGGLFLAVGVALSLGIQLTYHSGSLFPRYPVVDEVLGGMLGVVEGGILIVAFLMITDPYFQATAGHAAATGEFTPIRTVHEFMSDSLTADALRHSFIANLVAVLGFMFPQDVVETFTAAIRARLA